MIKAEVQRQPKLLHMTTVPLTLHFLRGQVDYMKAQGFQVEVLSSPGELLDEFVELEHVQAHVLEMQRRITPLRDMQTMLKIRKCFQDTRPQIVHAHTPKAGLLGMLAAWLACVPVRVYHIHGLPSMTATGLKQILLQSTERISCLLAQHVLCVSHSVRNVVIAERVSPAKKVQVLLGGSINGVDTEQRFNPANISSATRQETRAKYRIPEGSPVVGFVGRIVRDKGIKELAAAWAKLRGEFPNACLLIVGDLEPQDPVPQSVYESLQNDNRVHMIGHVRKVEELYAIMDLLVLPSYREGLPVVPLEAAAMALPVVATRIPGTVEAVQDDVTGTLVPDRDATALADAIRSYLCDPELRREHGRVGRERMQREFRQQAIWEATYQVYVRLLCEKGLTPPRA